MRKASACVAALLSAAALAQTPAAVMKSVDDHYNRLKSLRTHYVEHYEGMGLTRAESGTLVLKKPGRMLWRYDVPAGKVFVLDGKTAWFYTPGDREVQRMPAKKLDDLRTPLRFLLGHTQLAKELDRVAVMPFGAGFRITGVPRGMEGRVEQIALMVTSAGAIDEMTLEEAGGATTTFRFSDSQENVPAKDSDFLFTPPPGVTVVDAMPPV